LVVNLTSRLESCGPVEKKFLVVDLDIVLLNKKNRPTPDAFMTTTPAPTSTRPATRDTQTPCFRAFCG
jgi:hypothetical protein